MSMKDDIKQFPIFMLYNGDIYTADWVKDTESYNHHIYQLHHYIKQQDWKRNKEWFEERGIEQKLFLLPVQCHLDLHACLTGFEKKWGVQRDRLLYGAKF